MGRRRELRIRLEAYTFSNRGEMRQHLPTGYDIYLSPPWLEASTSNPLVLGTGFQPAVLCYYHCAEDYVHGYSEYRPPAYAVVVDCRLCSGVLQLSSSYARG